MDPACLVLLVEGGLNSQAHLVTQLLGWPTEGGRLPEQDSVAGNAGVPGILNCHLGR